MKTGSEKQHFALKTIEKPLQSSFTGEKRAEPNKKSKTGENWIKNGLKTGEKPKTKPQKTPTKNHHQNPKNKTPILH